MPSPIKTHRHLQKSLPPSAIPRSQAAIYLRLNRLAMEKERLGRELDELQLQIASRQQRLAEITAEMQSSLETSLQKLEPRSTQAQPASHRVTTLQGPVGPGWQTLVVEY